MGIVGGTLARWLLQSISPPENRLAGSKKAPIESKTKSNLETHFGADFIDQIRGKTVLDFGCGFGVQSVEVAKLGASKVIGVDIQDSRLEGARALAKSEGVEQLCHFTKCTDEKADIILSKDSFEHFEDPAAILTIMESLLKPVGKILASFGPTWYHPYGGHLFSVFPWAHLILTEKSLIEWRGKFKNDGATRFGEVEGGLNQLTIAHFESLVAKSSFCIRRYSAVPIAGIKIFAWKPLREYGASLVRYELVKRGVSV